MRSQVLLSFVVVALYWFSTYVYVPYQTAFLTDLGVGATLVGVITGSYGLAQIFLRPPLGIMIDLQGKQKPYILVGVITPGIASLIRVFTMSATGFLIANLLSGLGAAMWICFLVFFTRFFAESSMQKSSSILMAANLLGQLVGFLMSALLYTQYGMKVLCWLSVAAAAVATVLALTMREDAEGLRPDLLSDGSEGNAKVRPADLWPVFSNKRLLFFSIFAIGQTGIVLATATSFNTKIILAMGGSENQVGISMVIFMAVSVVCSFLAANDRVRSIGSKHLIPFALACITVFCFVTPHARTITQIYLLQMVAGIYAGSIVSFIIGEATLEIPAYKRTTAMGIFQCFVGIGITVIPMAVGKLVDRYDLVTAYAALGVFSAVLFLLAVWGTRTKRLDATPQQLEALKRLSG
jgi:MFS family permease